MKKRYNVQVTMEVYGWITVDASDSEEALELASQKVDDMDLGKLDTPVIMDTERWSIGDIEEVEEE